MAQGSECPTCLLLRAHVVALIDQCRPFEMPDWTVVDQAKAAIAGPRCLYCPSQHCSHLGNSDKPCCPDCSGPVHHPVGP